MSCYQEVPELLEQYIETSGRAEQWLAVKEIRMHFHLAG
jgi:hypothetical protein